MNSLVIKKTEVDQFTLRQTMLLGVLFFSLPCYYSVRSFLKSFANSGLQGLDWTTITPQESAITMLFEITVLTFTFAYLRHIRFGLFSFDFSFSKYTVPAIAVLVISGALAADIGSLICNLLLMAVQDAEPEINEAGVNVLNSIFTGIPIVWVLFAILNGFFEEFYFMGIVFLTDKKKRRYAILLSLAVRFLFHTYQGIPAAVGVLSMGIIFVLFRHKTSSILPFTIAHAIFDVFGVGLMGWLAFLLE